MATYVYPTNVELQEVAQVKTPKLTMDDPIFSILPIRDVDAAEVEWEQLDNYVGLQALRGLGGAPARVNRVGAKRYRQPPGAYGEFVTIDETEITRRRPMGTWEGPINVSDLVMSAQDQLLTRRIELLRYIGWTLLTTGTFSVANGVNGGVQHSGTFTLQTSSGSDWSTVATATPLQDFRAVKLLGRGYGVSFGKQAKAYMNSTTANRMMNNTNASDLGGKRVLGGNSVNTLSDFNRILLDNDLPEIVEYDEGYQNDSDTFVNFVADDKVIVVGARPAGQRLGEYQMVRNANNVNEAPGAYMKVVDDPNRVPRLIEVHDGHNGGPVIFFPSAIVIMSV